ncbi:MAG: kynureninase [Xanthomonadales bacterium]|nr:kynureninase [Xanthomonadales bacterium]
MNRWTQQARELDAADPLSRFREEFWIPRHDDGTDQLYFCGNSLGLQPKRLEAEMARELVHWKDEAVEGHFKGELPWMPYHENLREPLAALVGARPSEVVAMNSLTVNLHLLMVSFFRPKRDRCKIVIERQPFPSDRYAVESQLRFHGLDPSNNLVQIGEGASDRVIDEQLLEDYLSRHGDEVALVLWPGVHYATGQLFDLSRLTAAAHAAGAMVGFDLAHAAGNVPLALHDDGPDFAAWCSYKYLNSGPGAVAACFVHQRHHDDSAGGKLPRFQGWWGTDPETRFYMGPEFIPAAGADAWQLSNPPVLALAPVRVSLQVFQEAGMDALRERSVRMTGWLESVLQEHFDDLVQILTPAEPERRGCQLSLRVCAGREAGRRLFQFLQDRGVITDWREPDVIRVAPVPLYNRFEDCAGLCGQLESFRSAI